MHGYANVIFIQEAPRKRVYTTVTIPDYVYKMALSGKKELVVIVAGGPESSTIKLDYGEATSRFIISPAAWNIDFQNLTILGYIQMITFAN